MHFSSRPRGGQCSGSQPLPRHPGRRDPGTHPRAASASRGFSRLRLRPARLPPGSRLRPLPVPAPFPTAGPGASSPPPLLVPGGEGGGPRRGCDSSRPDQCQQQPRFSARCQLALSSGTEGRLGAPCRWGWGTPPPKSPAYFPPPASTPRGASPPSLAGADLTAGPARNWPVHFAWNLQPRSRRGARWGESPPPPGFC